MQAKREAKYDFYGLSVVDIERFREALSNVYADSLGQPLFEYTPGLVDKSILCTGKIDYLNTIDLSILNNSKAPIEFNYISDQFYAVTEDSSLFKYEVVFSRLYDISFRNYHAPLNPKQTKIIKISTDVFKRLKIEYLLCSINHGKTHLVLQKINKNKP